jgi:NADPH:quinone reductase-like Zn-dependent oxidoreductase
VRRPKATILGRDVAGTVEAAGSQVTRFRPGDEVFGVCSARNADLARELGAERVIDYTTVARSGAPVARGRRGRRSAAGAVRAA